MGARIVAVVAVAALREPRVLLSSIKKFAAAKKTPPPPLQKQ
jgi:hypothetical protein